MKQFVLPIMFFTSFFFLQAQESTTAYMWTGAVDSNWQDPGNWNRGSNPLAPPIPDGTSRVLIRNAPNYPKLESATNARAKEVVVNDDAKLDIAEFYITNNSNKRCKIDLSGTLLLKGTSEQKAWFDTLQAMGNESITLRNDCIVSYYDSSYDSVEIWRGPYQNLATTRSLKAGSISVKKTFRIDGSVPLTIEAAYHEYKGDILISCDALFKSNNQEGLKALGKIDAGTFDITFECNKVSVAGEITAKNLELKQASGENSFDARGNITLIANCTSFVNQFFTWEKIKAIDITINRGEWKSEGEVESDNISIPDGSTKWTSLNNVSVDGNILANVATKWEALSGVITVSGNIIANGFQQSDGRVILSGTGAQSIKAKKLKELEISATSQTTWQGIGSEQIIEKVTNAGSLAIDLSSSDLKIKELYNSNAFTSYGTLTVEKLENNAGTFSVKANASLSVENLENTATFGTEAGANVEIKSFANKTGATFNALSSIKLSKELTNRGVFVAPTLVLVPQGEEITIEGSDDASKTNLGDVSLEGVSGKTLTFKNHITLGAGTKLSGVDEDNLLAVKGDGTLHLATANIVKAKYLAVETNIPVAGGPYYTERSKPSGDDNDIKRGKPENWIFDDGLLPLTWWGGGTASTQWNLDVNWAPRSLPTAESDVIIPSGCASYPILTQNENVKSVVIENSAKLDLDGFILQNSVGTAKMELSGLLRMKGQGAQKHWLEETDEEKKITHREDSTIEYYDVGTDIWVGPYANLILARSVNAESIEVKKDLTIKDTIPPSSTPLVVNAKTQKYIGSTTIERDASFEAENEAKFGAIEAIDKSVDFKASNVEVAQETKASNIKLEEHTSSSMQSTFKFLGSITLSGTALTDGKLEANIKKLFTSGNLEARTVIISRGVWKSEKKVTVSENINLSGTDTEWESLEDIEVLGNISANDIKWKAISGDITVKGDVVANNLQQTLGKVFLNGNGAQSINAKKLKELGILHTSQTTWHAIGSKQVIEKITNAGALAIEASSDLEIKELFNSDTIVLENATRFNLEKLENTAGTFRIQAGANVSIASLINKQGATFNSLSPITLSKTLVNKGGVTVSTLTLSPEGNDIVIEGSGVADNTKIATFALEHANSKELIIKEKIAIENSLKLSGAGESQMLTIRGEGAIKLVNVTSDEGLYLVVHTNIPIERNKYITKRSRPEGDATDIDAGKPENWIFDDSSDVMKWHGGISNNWIDRDNWRPRGLPSEKTEIVIPAGRSNYPLLRTGNAPKGRKLTIENDGQLDLDVFVIETTSSTTKIKNDGTLKLKGTLQQKAWFEETNQEHNISMGAGSLVQYYGNLQDDVWTGPYQNLATSRSLHSNAITVEKTFTITPNSVHPANPIIIDANTQNYRGVVNISIDATFKGTGHGIFKKILATGQTIVFDMQDVRVEEALHAKKLNLSGTMPNSSFLAKYDIVLSDALISSAFQLKTEKNIEAKTITTRSAKWTSNGDITVLQDINTNATSWQAVDGIITVGGSVFATGLVQGNGKLILKSATPQKLVAKKIEVLEVENEASTGKVELSLDIISTFLLKKGNVELLKNTSFIKKFTNMGGVFDAVLHKAIVRIEPINSFTLQAKAKIEDSSAETANTGTKFYQLHCKGAGGKSLRIEGAIEVLYDISGEPGYMPPSSSSFSQDSSSLILEGSSTSKLNVIGNGQIWFNKTPPFPKAKKGGKFLHVASTVEIRGGYYRVGDSTCELPVPRGWLFEEYAKLLASLAITGSNEVCLIFSTPVARPHENSLKITAPSFPDMISIDVAPYPKGSTAHKSDKWIYKFASPFTADILLEKNALLSMGNSPSDFIFESPTSDKYPHKQGYISDIGLNLLENILAKNTKKIDIFDGSKQLPLVNTSVLADVPIDSNIVLYVAPTSDSKYWVPTGIGSTGLSSMSIDAPPPFLLSLSSDAGLSNAKTKAFIIPSTVPQFVKSMGVEFMFSYDGLPCARLQNKNNIFSFTLWKFGFITTLTQRGGVSIYNNVINPNKGQETTIELTTKKGGILTIEIMSIDGSIVKTIANEYKGAGTYNYFWDGFNSSGGMVGRGLYFVRIVGGGVDEVRKVLVVRD